VSVSAAVASAAKAAVYANPVVSNAAKTFYAAVQAAAAFIPPEWRWSSTRFLAVQFPGIVFGSFNGTRIITNQDGQARAYVTIDQGSTWVNNTFIATGQGLTVGAMSYDGTHCVIAGVSSHIQFSTNGGLNWTTVTPSPFVGRAWRAITMSSDGSKAAVAEGDNGYIYTAVRSGSTWTWTRQTSSGARIWSWLASSADGNILVAGEGSNSYISTDSGVTWSAARATGIAGALSEVTSSADGGILLGRQGGNTTTLFKSTNGGSTWTAMGPSKNWRGSSMSANGVRMIAALNGEIWLSEDSGAVWKQQPNISGGDMRAIYISGDGNRVAVASYGSSKVFFASYS
jgi:photosystem II stability/assembly factor-like uncharacterized protein